MTHTWIFPQLLLPHHNPNPPPLHTLFLLIRSIVCIHWRCNSYLVYKSSPIIFHLHCHHCSEHGRSLFCNLFLLFHQHTLWLQYQPLSKQIATHTIFFCLTSFSNCIYGGFSTQKKVFPMKLQWMERAGICLITMSDCYRLYFHCVPSLLCCR